MSLAIICTMPFLCNNMGNLGGLGELTLFVCIFHFTRGVLIRMYSTLCMYVFVVVFV